MNEVIALNIKLEAKSLHAHDLQVAISNRLAYMSADMNKLSLMIKNHDIHEVPQVLEHVVDSLEKIKIQASELRCRYSPDGKFIVQRESKLSMQDASANRPSTLDGLEVEHDKELYPMQVGRKGLEDA